jgi:alkaline phosphatase
MLLALAVCMAGFRPGVCAQDDQAIRPTICQLAKQAGKVVGTVSSVQWSHATRAAFSNVHNVSRNNYPAIAQEMVDFNQAVACVIAWMEDHGGWDENLLIITTDHGNGMPMGPQSHAIPHASITLEDVHHGHYVADMNEQGVRWWTGSHTNELVPLFARGAGADLFDSLIDGIDPYFGIAYGDWAAAGFDGRYLDNTDIFAVLSQVGIASAPCPGEK